MQLTQQKINQMLRILTKFVKFYFNECCVVTALFDYPQLFTHYEKLLNWTNKLTQEREMSMKTINIFQYEHS